MRRVIKMVSLVKENGTKILSLASYTLLVALLVLLLLTGSAMLCASSVEASGSQKLIDLEIGDKVVDPSWEWEFRSGNNYTPPVIETKPVVWIIVAKDHYGPGSGVTLLSEELIGNLAFDNHLDEPSGELGFPIWIYSGTGNATIGLRPWLNSTGIHEGEGFYNAFLLSFKDKIIKTTLPNKFFDGTPYNTQDKVFAPSRTELGDIEHFNAHQTGTVYPHFHMASDADRIAKLGSNNHSYRTRCGSTEENWSGQITQGGGFANHYCFFGDVGVRPALSLKAETLVSATPNADGVYELIDLDSPTPKYIYYENTLSELVKVDYNQAVKNMMDGDRILYYAIVDAIVDARLGDRSIFVEDMNGYVIDYSAALDDGKNYVGAYNDSSNYEVGSQTPDKELVINPDTGEPEER